MLSSAAAQVIGEDCLYNERRLTYDCHAVTFTDMILLVRLQPERAQMSA